MPDHNLVVEQTLLTQALLYLGINHSFNFEINISSFKNKTKPNTSEETLQRTRMRILSAILFTDVVIVLSMVWHNTT